MGCICQKIRNRKFSKVGDKPDKPEDGQNSIPCLTNAQKAVIRNNWQVLKLHIANVGVITFVSMFESRPELKDVFASFRGKNLDELQRSGLIRSHALRVMATIDKCVTRLDEPDNLASILIENGRRHSHYMVHSSLMQNMLQPFLKAIRPHIEDCWSDDVEKAWQTLFSVILYYIKEGIDMQSKLNVKNNDASQELKSR